MFEKVTTYTLTRSLTGAWNITLEGTSNLLGTYNTKDDAIKAAVDIAKKHQPSKVITREVSGQVKVEQTFGNNPNMLSV